MTLLLIFKVFSVTINKLQKQVTIVGSFCNNFANILVPWFSIPDFAISGSPIIYWDMQQRIHNIICYSVCAHEHLNCISHRFAQLTLLSSADSFEFLITFNTFSKLSWASRHCLIKAFPSRKLRFFLLWTSLGPPDHFFVSFNIYATSISLKSWIDRSTDP